MTDEFTSVQWDRESKIISGGEAIDNGGEGGIDEGIVDEGVAENSTAEEPIVESIKPLALDSNDTPSTEDFIIETTVSDPIKDLDQSSKPYTSYLVTTKTNDPSIIKLCQQDEIVKDDGFTIIKSRRRYGDFRNLYHCLTNDFPMNLIPSIPSKSNLKYLTGDTFSEDFINKRLNSLNRFLKFLNEHKDLKKSSIYNLFLSNSNDWVSFSKNLKVNINEIDNKLLPNNIGKIVNEDLITETLMNFLTPSKYKKETNKEILEIIDKLNKLYENLMKLDKIFQRINKKNSELSIDYEIFSNEIKKLNFNEQSETDTETNDFEFFSKLFKEYSNNWMNNYKFIDENFLITLKDCSKYIINLNNLIELQHNKKIDLQVLKDYLNKTRNEYNSLETNRAPPSPIKHNNGMINNTTQLIKDTLTTSNNNEKANKLRLKIEELEDEIKIQSDLLNNLINKIINEEYPNWDIFNKNELKRSMVELCDNQIEFYNNLVNEWGDTETKLMKKIEKL